MADFLPPVRLGRQFGRELRFSELHRPVF